MRIDRVTMLSCSVVVAAVVGGQALAGNDLHVAEFQASAESRVEFFRSPVVAQASDDRVSIELSAKIAGATGDLFVDIRPEWSSDYIPQDRVYRVEGEVVRGVIQLALRDSVRHSSRFYFRLRDAAGRTLVEGTIVLQGYRLATPLTIAATWIGLFAGILQIVFAIGETFPRAFGGVFPTMDRGDDTGRDRPGPTTLPKPPIEPRGRRRPRRPSEKVQ